jgi:4-amino-4-deoxy-L-arabinose transferase-like glycosyltransferase
MGRRQLFGLAGLAAAVRVVYVFVFMRDYAPRSDADSYYNIARAIARGDGFVHPLPFHLSHATAIRPPLYPTVVGGAFKVFGSSVGVAQACSITFGVLAVVVGACIGAHLAGARGGLLSGIVLACYPPLVANDTTVLVESLAVVLALACVLMLVQGRTVWAAVALGLLMLDRASAQWLIVPLGLWVLWRLGWRHALRFAIVAVLMIVPWVVRNEVMVGGPVLVATNGFNLNAVYSPEAAGKHDFVDAYFDNRFAAIRLAAFDEVDLDAILRARALDELRDHPTEAPRVWVRNAAKWLELTPGHNRNAEELDGRHIGVRTAVLPLFYLVTAAGVAGLVTARRRAAAQLLAIVAGYTTLVCIASIAVPRLRSLFDAPVAIGAGVFAAWLLEHRPRYDRDAVERRPVRVRATALVLAAVVVAVGLGAVLYRERAHDDANDQIASVLANSERAFDLPVVGESGPPPEDDDVALAQLRALTSTLFGRTPSAPPGIQAEVRAAASATRRALRTADVVGLLSASELLRPETGTPSVANVRRRYEELRAADNGLVPWGDVVGGRTVDDARRAVRALCAAMDPAARPPGRLCASG